MGGGCCVLPHSGLTVSPGDSRRVVLGLPCTHRISMEPVPSGVEAPTGCGAQPQPPRAHTLRLSVPLLPLEAQPTD